MTATSAAGPFIFNCAHGVHPAMPCAACGRGYPAPMTTTIINPAVPTPVCPACGALVGDEDKHAAYHSEQA